jgi:filamentous hemagglutinin family protein
VALNDAPAQVATTIKTDASWGRTPAAVAPGGPAIVTANRASYAVSGNVYAIPQTLGKAAGPNLFHSFETFSVGSGDAAVFTTTSSFNNVISRVSGAAPSSIQGLLALAPAAGSKPNFFFINPNGITFGAGAQVDVPAALHVSTANNLRFADGTTFKAGAGSDSTLTIAPPASFGFLGATRAPIVIDSGTSLVTIPGESLSVVGGDVLLDHTLLVNQGGGDVRVTAVGADAVEIGLTGGLPPVHGELDIVAGGGIVVTSFRARDSGSVAVSAGDIWIDGRGGGGRFTGISSIVMPGTGRGGDITVAATGTLSMIYAGILSDSYSTLDAGPITLRAGSLLIDGQGQGSSVGVLGLGVQQGITTSTYEPAGFARTGPLTVSVDGDLALVSSGKIYSGAGSSGSAAPVTVTAQSISADAQNATTFFTGIASISNGPVGSGADLDVSTRGNLSLHDGASILAATNLAGAAGSVMVHARTLEIDRGQSSNSTGIARQGAPGSSGAPRNVEVTVLENISIKHGGSIVSDAFSGRAGDLHVHAGSMTLDGRGTLRFTGIASDSIIGYFADAGDLDVFVAGELSILAGARISSSTFSSGAAGSLKLRAGSLTMDGGGNPMSTGIHSAALLGSSGDAGVVDAEIEGKLSILNGASISSNTFSEGNAGSVNVRTGSLFIDRQESASFTGIASASAPEASGNAGRVRVSVAGDASMVHFGAIASDTLSSGDAGDVAVFVGGKLSLRGGAGIASATFGAGNAGSVDVAGGRIEIDDQNTGMLTGVSASAGFGSSGHAGAVHVSALGDLSIVDGGLIASVSNSPKNAGTVDVAAENISISGRGLTAATGVLVSSTDAGDGGQLRVSARGTLALLGDAVISSTSDGIGRAGSIHVDARDIVIDGQNGVLAPGIQASSQGTNSGDAGDITISATHSLTMLRRGYVEASTFSTDGRSGSVTVDAPRIVVDGPFTEIGAAAAKGSSGKTGTLSIHAADAITLSNGGTLSIRNEASADQPGVVIPTLLSVSAASIELLNGGQISAAATGKNGAASNIRIQFNDRLTIDPSSITTSAEDGNGGSILIDGSGVIMLDHAQIKTSAGSSGNGGDITIHAGALVMNGGFIQANTEALGASGGNVAIDVRTFVPSGGAVIIGGATPLVFQPNSTLNVIQAAAPTGVSGRIEVNTPVTDISGSLHRLSTEVVTFGRLGKDLCRVGASSSLTPLGRGGMRATASGLLRPEGPIVIAAAERIDAKRPDEPAGEAAAQSASLRCER